MKTKQTKRIGLIFGGLGNEAEVSVMSAVNVAKYIDRKLYKLVPIYWHKADGHFYLVDDVARPLPQASRRISLEDFPKKVDIALPMTHGRYGEDGILQAMLESISVPYCGCGVLSSAICMDKAVLKELMAGAGIRQVRHVVLDFVLGSSKDIAAAKNRARKFRLPVFVKPSNSGSSVGITKVDSWLALDKAINAARRHDNKIVIEEGLVAPTELEIGVLGNDKLLVSRPGELRLAKEFYDYEDKYKLGEAQVVVPADIPGAKEKAARALAEKAYRLAGCRGFARVDLFLSRGLIYLNEINTLPGFTDISMYPVVMMNQGMSYQELITKIIRLAR